MTRCAGPEGWSRSLSTPARGTCTTSRLTSSSRHTRRTQMRRNWRLTANGQGWGGGHGRAPGLACRARTEQPANITSTCATPPGTKSHTCGRRPRRTGGPSSPRRRIPLPGSRSTARCKSARGRSCCQTRGITQGKPLSRSAGETQRHWRRSPSSRGSAPSKSSSPGLAKIMT